MLKQQFQLKLSQKLSPQQIQLMKLIQLPTQAFEQRISQELEENPALESGKELLDQDDYDDDPYDDFDEGTEIIETDINIDSYLSDDETPSYKLSANNYSADDQEHHTPYASGTTFNQFLVQQLNTYQLSEEDFDKVIEVNLKSVFNMTKAVQRTMLKQRHGSLIHMSSVVGVKGNAGQSNYAASKAGIIGFSKSIALELGSRNIRSNVIAPGFIETEMTEKLPEDVVAQWRANIPLKRGGSTTDIANACLFLSSDLSAYISGQVLNVDGGMLT